MNVKRLNQQIHTFKNILGQYNFEVPLARFLTSYFRRNRQMGSKDRKVASRLIYNYFRLGIALPELTLETRLAISEFLCTSSSDFVKLLEPALHASIEESIENKVLILENLYRFAPQQCFPLSEKISIRIDKSSFLLSHFQQRDLFIRLRPKTEGLVVAALEKNNIEFSKLGQVTLKLQNGSQLDKIKEIAGRYEVQDLSSQRVIDFLNPQDGESWWDACAASGGKSLLLNELNPTIQLLVSDLRGSILRNLDERFDNAGIRIYRKKIIDLTKDTTHILGNEKFDGVIVDAPCSGSGTWGRSPEQMSPLTCKKLNYCFQLLRDILDSIVRHVKSGKSLVYITCSVYTEEY